MTTEPLPELPALRSPRPWHALARDPSIARHVAFVEVAGAAAVVVLAGDVLTLLGLDGMPLGSPRVAPFTARPRRAFVAGGSVLVVEGWGALDLETMTPLDGEKATPRCVSTTGETFAGTRSGARHVDLWQRGAAQAYPPPVPRGLRPLAVTDGNDLLFAVGGEVGWYDYHRDETDPVLAIGKAKHLAASRDGGFVARATNTVTRLHAVPTGAEVAKVSRLSPEVVAAGAGGRLAVGAWDGKVVLVQPSGRTTLRAPGRPTSLAFSADGEHLAIGCAQAWVTVVATESAKPPPPRPTIVALRPDPEPLLALRSGRVVEAGADALIEHLPALDRRDGSDSLARSAQGPVHVRYSRDGACWRGAFEGETERSDGVAGHALSPDGERLALWVAPPQRLRPRLPRFDPALRVLDLASGGEQTHPVFGPVAFFDDGTLLAFTTDESEATSPVRLELATGELNELGRSNRNLPVQVVARGGAWAVQRADATVTVRPDPEGRWILGLRSLSRSGASAGEPILAMSARRLVLVLGGRVYVHTLADGTLEHEHELPFAPPVVALDADGALWFPRQDGDLGRLDLENGALTTRPV